MALLSDGTISTLEDLRNYENAILDVANSEQIDLSKKLILAQEEIEVELADFLLQQSVQSSPGQPSSRPDLGNVVVTPSVRQWHTFHTLGLVYRDAYNSHFNDRYLGKWKEYERLARWALRKSFDTGIGMVCAAIPKATPAVLSTIPGGLPGATYWVRATWTGATGEEGCPSDPAVLTTPDGSLLTAAVKDPPEHASGWNVYAGFSLDEAGLQNGSPMPLGSLWVMPSSGLVDGRKAGDGQSPAYFVTIRRVLQRG